MNALVIDDSKAIRLIMRRILRGKGFDVLEAADGMEALRVIESAPVVDLILVDWNMPVMNGLEFIEQFRSDPENSDARVMMVTTETEVSQVVRAIEAGANEYVMKPFTEEIITDKLDLLGFDVRGEARGIA